MRRHVAPARRRWIDRTADVFVLLPAGFGALFLILDLVPAEGMQAPSSAPLFAGGVLMTLALRVWFRAEDRSARRRALRAARAKRGSSAAPPSP